MQYRAFLSYSRSDDRTANWLHRQLDRYRTPSALVGAESPFGPIPAKLFPIFRDRTDLAVGGELTGRISAALADSELLVVLCSPAAAASPWVDSECAAFVARGHVDRIFPVIAAGLPDTDDVERDFFPPSIRGRGLLAADMREIRLPSGKVVGDGREGARLKLLAGVLGTSLDQLIQRERRRQRLVLAGFIGASIVFAGLAVAAGGFGWLADVRARAEEQARQQADASAQEATRERDRAQEALARIFIQRAWDSANSPAARARYALAGLTTFPALASDFRLALGGALQDQSRLLASFSSAKQSGVALFTAGGKSILISSSDGVVSEYDTATGKLIQATPATGFDIRKLALSSDQSRLAIAQDGPDTGKATRPSRLRMVDRRTGKDIWSVETKTGGVLWDVAISPNDRFVAIVSDGAIAEIHDAATGALLFTLKPPNLRLDQPLFRLLFSRSSDLLVTASNYGELSVWRTSDGGLQRTLYEDGQSSVRDLIHLGPRGDRIVASSNDGIARIWDIRTGKLIRRLEGHTNWVDDIAADAEGKIIVTGSTDTTARIWNADTGETIATLPKFSAPVWDVDISPDGSHVLAISADGTATLASSSGDVIARFLLHEGPAYEVGFSDDGRLAFTSGAVQTVRLWATVPPHTEADDTDISANHTGNRAQMDGDEFYVAESNGDVSVRRVQPIQPREPLRVLKGHTMEVKHIALAGDRSIVATVSDDKTGRIWKRSTGESVAVLRGHIFPIQVVALSPDARFALTAARDETARLWDTVTGREIVRWPTEWRWMEAAGFSADGTRAIAEGGSQRFAWDISRLAWTGEQAQAFACTVFLAPDQRVFTESERENDPLVRDIWLNGNRAAVRDVCKPGP